MQQHPHTGGTGPAGQQPNLGGFGRPSGQQQQQPSMVPAQRQVSHAPPPGLAPLGKAPAAAAGPSQQQQQQQFGFTKAQLETLKAQILAFRRVKKGEQLTPAELPVLKPPPLHASPFASATSSAAAAAGGPAMTPAGPGAAAGVAHGAGPGPGRPAVPAGGAAVGKGLMPGRKGNAAMGAVVPLPQKVCKPAEHGRQSRLEHSAWR